MSAEKLRRTAALMRERAEAATPGPWEHYGDGIIWPSKQGPAANDPVAATSEAHEESAPHIASWHPTVALAVADWLDAARCHLGCGGDGFRTPYCSLCEDSTCDHDCPPAVRCEHSLPFRKALAIADAYLGEQS